MKRKLLLIPCLVLFSYVVNAQSVVINKLFNNTNTGNQYGGGVNGQGDAIELLVLEDHTDLRNAYIKETYNISTAPASLKEGAIWQFTDNALWSNLRAGTTIQLVRPPITTAPSTAIVPALDIDATGDNHLLIPMAAASSDYLISVPSTVTPLTTWLFNLQLRDAVTLKRGSPYGYDDLIHMLMIGYATADAAIIAEYDNITGTNKSYTNHTFSGTATNNGLLFYRNPTAETAPHNALGDYLGADDDNSRNIVGWATTNNSPQWGIGLDTLGSLNKKFIAYLRDSPKIENIEYVSAALNSETAVYKVTFNKNVSNVTAADFDVQFNGSALGSITSVTGENNVWNVTIGELTGEGNIRIYKKNVTGITDGINNFFNGFSIYANDYHAVKRTLVLRKPDAPIVAGAVNSSSTNLVPTLTGNVVPGARVNLFVDGTMLNVVINSNATTGDWSYTLPSALSSGIHTFHVTVTLTGVTSEKSDDTVVNFVSYVGGIPAEANAVVINKIYNSGILTPAGQDDVVELLVLDDHVDLANLFLKDQAGGASGTLVYNDNGGKYQFRDIPLWKNLRSGTTIVLRRTPSVYTLDADPSDGRLDISLDDTNYFITVATGFNLQNYDMVVLKGGSSALGYDNMIHAFIAAVNNNTRPVFDAFPEPKMGINALIPTSRGLLYANNPTAATAPHKGIVDYSGFVNTDRATTVTAGSAVTYTPDPPIIKTSFNDGTPNYHIGEAVTNRIFISYLTQAPRIEYIAPTIAGGKGSSVVFNVVFSKNVTGVDVSDFRLQTTNNANGVITSVTGSGSTYQVTVSNLSGNGNITLVKKASNTAITDGARLFFEGFEYLKGNPYQVDDLPLLIPVPEAPMVSDAVNGVSDNFMPVISGNANSNVNINLYIDDVLVNEQIVTNRRGEWSYKLNTSLTTGEHKFEVTTTAFYGTSEKSSPTIVQFNLPVPALPVIANLLNGVTNSLRPLLSGTGKPGNTINIYLDGALYISGITVNESGTWSYRLTESLSLGDHSFEISTSNALVESDRSEKIAVTVKLETGKITINNILTPNGDGKNDVWLIDNLKMYPNNEVIVYDKVGKVVYRQQNYQQDWDGTSEGRLLKPGTYYYHINLGPDLDPLKGFITLLTNN